MEKKGELGNLKSTYESSLPNVQGLLQAIKDECTLWCMPGASKLSFFSILVTISSILGAGVLGLFECLCVFWLGFFP